MGGLSVHYVNGINVNRHRNVYETVSNWAKVSSGSEVFDTSACTAIQFLGGLSQYLNRIIQILKRIFMDGESITGNKYKFVTEF